MCGRFSIVATAEKMKAQLEINLQNSAPLLASYNIAPTQSSLVITNEAPKELQIFRWGLVPHWAKDSSFGAKLINARCEGIASKPSFRVSIRQKRCLVVADSFYEWKKSGGQKYPYRILLADGQLMLMAGVWDEWQFGKKKYQTFSIITTAPNKEMSSIHTRMPVILTSKEQQQKWLENIELEQVLALLQTPDNGILKCYRVSQNINSVKPNNSDLHKEVNDDLLTLF